jgi:polyvinyl alcohol dehydrogenase (cytochrome)
MNRLTLLAATLALLLTVTNAFAQPSSQMIRQFEERCATCHRNAGVDRAIGAAQAPEVAILQRMSPEAVYRVLMNSPIPVHTQNLDDNMKRAFAEFLGGRKLGGDAGDAKVMQGRCQSNVPLPDFSKAPAWNGWGVDATNARFQSAQASGLTAAQVPRLKLKWAFGFPGASSMFGQPTVAAGRVFIGVDTGYVYSLDAATGCFYWSFRADAGVRNAISIGAIEGQRSPRYAVYFGDLKANVYAVDAATGVLIWKVRVEEHPLAVVTGAPTLYRGRLYVPVASREEAAGSDVNYPCCTFRGSVSAIDTTSGNRIWKTYIIAEEPRPTEKNSRGVQLWSPSGAGVWASPTIDEKRGAVYIATGDAYSNPAPKTTDAIMALDIGSGRVRWVVQHTEGDAWLVGCETQSPSENCPDDLGPDYDFGASAMMRTLSDGRTVLISGQKSGEVFAQDAGRGGAVMWKATLVDKLARGEIVFGGAADDQAAYFGLRGGYVTALDLRTGARKWTTPVTAPQPPRQGRGLTAALSVIPGVLFSGGWDGLLRAFATDDGRVLWEYDMFRDFTTVNGVPAKGGSMGGPGPTIAGGMVFAGSGYLGVANGTPGNVLLAFSVD